MILIKINYFKIPGCLKIPIKWTGADKTIDPGGLAGTDGEMAYWPGIPCCDWRLDSRSPSADGRLAV